MNTTDDTLPAPALLFPIDGGESATLVRSTATLEGGADFLAGVAMMSKIAMQSGDTNYEEYAPRVVWPKPTDLEGLWVCQASGEELEIGEIKDLDTEHQIAEFTHWWTLATIE